jgi:salicylate hydroxylase
MVQYPIRDKKVINQVAVFQSRGFLSGAAEWGTEEELDEAYSQCCSTILHSMEYINRDRNWKLHDREPIPHWTVGRVTLLGDSAHAMLQYLAQGGVQALEDAVCLGDKVAAYDDVEKALLEYEKERVPRASQVQRGARMWGEIKHAREPETLLLRNTLMQNRPSDDYQYLDWMYMDYRKALLSK